MWVFSSDSLVWVIDVLPWSWFINGPRIDHLGVAIWFVFVYQVKFISRAFLEHLFWAVVGSDSPLVLFVWTIVLSFIGIHSGGTRWLYPVRVLWLFQVLISFQSLTMFFLVFISCSDFIFIVEIDHKLFLLWICWMWAYSLAGQLLAVFRFWSWPWSWDGKSLFIHLILVWASIDSKLFKDLLLVVTWWLLILFLLIDLFNLHDASTILTGSLLSFRILRSWRPLHFDFELILFFSLYRLK